MNRPYKPGDLVKVLHNGERGTTLSPGRVAATRQHADGRWEVTTELGSGEAVTTFTTAGGGSDYLLRDTEPRTAREVAR